MTSSPTFELAVNGRILWCWWRPRDDLSTAPSLRRCRDPIVSIFPSIAVDRRRERSLAGQFSRGECSNPPEDSVERVLRDGEGIHIDIYIYIEGIKRAIARARRVRSCEMQIRHVILNRPIVQTPVAPDARASITRGGVARFKRN